MSTNPQSNIPIGAMNMSLGGTVFQMMSILTKWESSLVSLFNAFQGYQAKLLGGFGGSGPGLIKQCLDLSIKSAEDQGTSIRKQAEGSLIQGCVAGVGVLGTAGAGLKFLREGQTGEDLEDTKEFQRQLNKATPAHVVQNGGAPAPTAASAEIEQQINTWTKPGAMDGVSFSKPMKNGTVDGAQQQLNERAVDALRQKNVTDAKGAEQFEAVSKNVAKKIDNLKEDLSDRVRNFNTATTFSSQIIDSAGKLGNYSPQIQQAEAQENSSKESAEADVLRQVNQTVEERGNAAAQRANAAQQKEDEAAEAIARLLQAHGRA